MASEFASHPPSAGGAPDLTPVAAVLISERCAAMSMRVSPTLHAQGLAAVVMDAAVPGGLRELPPLLRARPAGCIGFVDDSQHVGAARALGLGLVVGIGSGTRATALEQAGTDLTVSTPAELCAGVYFEAYAQRFAGVPDALADLPRLTATLGRPGEYGVVLDARSLLHPRAGAALSATLRRLPPWVPVALLGGAGLDGLASGFDLRTVLALAHDGLGLAPAELRLAGRRALDAAVPVLHTLGRAFDLPALRDEGVALHLPAGPGRDHQPSAALRRAAMRALSALPGLHWESDAHGLDVRPALAWPARERVEAVRAHWQAQGVRRLLFVCAGERHEDWLRALGPADAGVRVAPTPIATAAHWRLARAADLPELLHRLTA